MARMQMTLCMQRSTHYRYILRAIKLLSRSANLRFCSKNFNGALFTSEEMNTRIYESMRLLLFNILVSERFINRIGSKGVHTSISLIRKILK